MKTVVFSVLVLCATALGYPLVPDTSRTPGELCTDDNPHFTEYRYGEQIAYCARQVSATLKRRIYEAYGIPERERKDYTIDHLLPLAIGGDNAMKNLWPEHKEVKALRPNLEVELFVQMRDGDITQREAIRIVMEAKLNPRRSRRPLPLASRYEADVPVYATP